MELKTQKALFTLGVNAFGKIAEIIKNTDYLPQKPLNHFKLLKLVLDKDPKTDFSNLVNEIKKDKELVKSLIGALSSQEKYNVISPENFINALSDLEKTFLQNLIQVNVAKKYSQILKLSSSKMMQEDWKLCLKSSVIAVSIAKWVELSDLEMAFMGSLLSEVPSLVMNINDSHTMQYVEEKMANGMPKRNAEVLAFGFDHAELGSKLFRYYGMPSEIIDLIQMDLESEKVKSKNKKLADVINFAKYIAESFSDKTQSPSSIWSGSQKYIHDLGLNINPEDWGNKISLLFVKSLEFEMSVMS
jgi:HD-like signal output (HDOD) protein